jgi:outer membrane protein
LYLRLAKPSWVCRVGVHATAVLAALWTMPLAASISAAADTVESALVGAYRNNPQVNVQRAIVRQADEQVPQALSGYRPRIGATATAGMQAGSEREFFPGSPPFSINGTFPSASAGVTAVQTLYNGFQTANRTRAAESQVSAQRATLRNTEQTVLLNALTAYMNVLRDYAILELQKRNVAVLQEELRQTRDRFRAGDVTATDVSQAESRLGAGQTQVLTAQANYETSVAVYRQVIGTPPGMLAPGTPVDRFCPPTLDQAFALADQHPNVIIAMYGADIAQLQVKIAEGALQPTLSLQGSVQQAWGPAVGVIQTGTLTAAGQLSVPIYQGGAEYSAVRQGKELVGQRLLELELTRRQIRETIAQAWSQVVSSKAQIRTTQIQVKAAESALNGVRDEARVGQRTTYDVLNAEQELVNARVAVVTAERDRVVASYTLLAAVGRLSPEVLGLKVETYDPTVHYQQVRDAWVGLRTPDGK